MKSIVSLLVFSFCFLSPNHAQKGITEEEWLYCSKGYDNQLSLGLDPVKKGYSIRLNASK